MRIVQLVLVLFLVAIDASAGSLCRFDERDVLLAFKFAVSNASRSLHSACNDYYPTDSWNGSECCDWDGVTCDDESGHVTGLELSCSLLQGEIPDGLFDLHSLKKLNLERNFLNGTIPLSKIHRLQNLGILMLSENSLSIIDDMGNDTTSSWPSFDVLSLSSCNLGLFPGFLRQQTNLQELALSNNGIHGVVPDWLFEMGSLSILNLSHNSLYGGLEQLPWQGMQELDIQYNLLQGNVPVPSPTTIYFWASHNQFTGEIFDSFCDIGSLALLVLAQNNLIGTIPDCFATLVSLNLLILEGPIPKSLSNCLNLQLLDLSDNHLNETFPHGLGVLPSLEVLVWASNNLQGSLMESNTTCSFARLRILDVSNNNLTGVVPISLLLSMRAMVDVNNTKLWPYMGVAYYQDSIVAWLGSAKIRLNLCPKLLVFLGRLDGSGGPTHL